MGIFKDNKKVKIPGDSCSSGKKEKEPINGVNIIVRKR
jgi:hypothetical protein